MTDRDGGRPRAAMRVQAGVVVAAMLWGAPALAAAAGEGADPVTIENAPAQSSVAIVPEDAPPRQAGRPTSPPIAPAPASAPPVTSVPAPTAPVQAAPRQAAPSATASAPPAVPNPVSSAPLPPIQAAPLQAEAPAAPTSPAPAPAPSAPVPPIQVELPPAPPSRPRLPPAAAPAPAVTRTLQSIQRPDGSIATVTTTTETVITPPPPPAAAAAAPDIPVQSFAAHRQGTLWRIAPRNGGNARLARLDLHEVGVEAHLAEQAIAGRATLLLAGRLVRDRGHRVPTLMVTAVEGGAPDR